MGELPDFQVGQTVELQDGRIATVHFVGETHFAGGDWVGVVLDDATGKNDGTVKGQRYFECSPGHGMFVRPVVATVIDQPLPTAGIKAVGKANGIAIKGRPESAVVAAGTRRQSVLDPTAGKKRSVNGGSPTPGANATTASRILRSPSKSPTKQLASTTSSGNVTPPILIPSSTQKSNAAKSRNSVVGRPSMGPPTSTAARTSRLSIAGTLNGAAKAPGRPSTSSTRGIGNRLSLLPDKAKRLSTISGGSGSSGPSGLDSHDESLEPDLLSPSISEDLRAQSRGEPSPALSHGSTPNNVTELSKPVSSPGQISPAGSQRGPINTTSSREIEDLKTRLSMMEKKRLEDREKLKALERIQSDRDKFEGIIQRLEGKLQPQQQEISNLKKQLRDSEAKFDAVETQQAENDAAIEMAALDREMAEETAESLKSELDALRQKNEELELEVEVLREENAELGEEMDPEERTSQGWLQMERSNERLREALMRLRDVTQQQDSESKQQIKELEKEIKDFGNVKAQYEEAKGNLERSNGAIEELRQQLDTALGAEEMIEELTEKNMSLVEQIDDLKTTIEDLESLKELNDELEINHVENENQLQAEIDHKESMMADQARRARTQEETIGDLEYTITRFRELVTNMQNDLEDMRASQQITETEASELTARSRAMMDLNMRLQVSASEAQVKAIDLEFRKLEAQQSAEHLAIVQFFLPESFDNNRDSVLALLRIKRIAFKAGLLHGFIKERINGQALAGHEDNIFTACGISDNLVWVNAMCNRFVSFIQTCSLEAFHRLEGALYDLDPVERAFNSWIEWLKRDELKEQLCSAELQRIVALMTHLAEAHISEGLEQYAEDIHMRALVMQSNLENAAAAMCLVKSMAQNKLLAYSNESSESGEEVEDFAPQADSLISQIRSAKVICGKAIRQLEELNSRSLTLDPSTLSSIEQSQTTTSEIASTTRSVGSSLFELVNQEARATPFSDAEIIQALCPDDKLPFSSLLSRINIATSHIQSFYTLTNTLSQTIEYQSPPSPPPWQILAKNLRTASATSASHETEVSRLKDELIGKNTALAMKDNIVEEMSVKVEVLEKRVGESGGRRERVRELEGVVEGAKMREKEIAKKLIRLQQDLQNVEAERDTMKKQLSQSGNQPGAQTASQLSAQQDGLPSATSLYQISLLKSEISTLQCTIRHLRLRSQRTSLSSSSTHSFLSTPLIPPRCSPTEPENVAHEARGLFKEMLGLVTRPENQVVRLVARERDERLKWRPKREEPKWLVGRQREEWEVWKEWRGDIVDRAGQLRKEEERKRQVKWKGMGVGQDVMGPSLPGADLMCGKVRQDTAIRIVRPGDWEGEEHSAGLA